MCCHTRLLRPQRACWGGRTRAPSRAGPTGGLCGRARSRPSRDTLTLVCAHWALHLRRRHGGQRARIMRCVLCCMRGHWRAHLLGRRRRGGGVHKRGGGRERAQLRANAVCERANGPRPHMAPRAAPRRAGLTSSEYEAARGGRGALPHMSPEVCALCPPSIPPCSVCSGACHGCMVGASLAASIIPRARRSSVWGRLCKRACGINQSGGQRSGARAPQTRDLDGAGMATSRGSLVGAPGVDATALATVRARVRACACVRACMRACVHACVRAW